MLVFVVDNLLETKPVQIYVSLTPAARSIIDQLRDDTGVPVTEAMKRILEWYASFDAKFRLAVLNRDPSVRRELTQLAMKSMAENPTKDLTPPAPPAVKPDQAKAVKAALEHSKKK